MLAVWKSATQAGWCRHAFQKFQLTSRKYPNLMRVQNWFRYRRGKKLTFVFDHHKMLWLSTKFSGFLNQCALHDSRWSIFLDPSEAHWNVFLVQIYISKLILLKIIYHSRCINDWWKEEESTSHLPKKTPLHPGAFFGAGSMKWFPRTPQTKK